jgi:hypothetical protein
VQGNSKWLRLFLLLYADPELRCSESTSNAVVIDLSCEGVPLPVATASCSFDDGPPFPCTFVCASLALP